MSVAPLGPGEAMAMAISRRATGLAVLALALVGAGVAVALAVPGQVEPRTTARDVSPEPPIATTAPPATGSAQPPASPTTPSPSPTVGPTALADGTYPAYVRAVDVRGGTLTVDVIQTFEGREAVRAAMEDGLSRRDARQYRYVPVYVRNENPLLRTLPVAEDVGIELVEGCDSSGDRTMALRELRRAVASFEETFYYALVLEGGSVTRVEQRVAVSAC